MNSGKMNSKRVPKQRGGRGTIDAKIGRPSKLTRSDKRKLARLYTFTKLSAPEMSRVLERFNGIHVA